MRITTPRRYTPGRQVSALVLLAVLVLALALAACGSGGGAGVTGTIAGDVAAGPTCPAEPAGGSCANRPVADRQVNIRAQSGATATGSATPQPGDVVATTTTDSRGDFTVNVPPGQYVVQVVTGPGMLGIRQTTPGDVTVVANQTSTVHIVLDTGIR